MDKKLPGWTVCYNIASKNSTWIGTGWEFFNSEVDADACYREQIKVGNCPTKRPYYNSSDREHLGAVHILELAGIDIKGE